MENVSKETFINKDHNAEWELFMRDQYILHEIYNDLIECTNEKDIYKKVVTSCLNKLEIDRTGILLISIEHNTMKGSWGTDILGNIIDQSDFEGTLDDDQWIIESLINRDYISISNTEPIKNMGKIIGYGWSLTSTFFDGDTPIGWIACDNGIHNKPINEWKKEVLGELGRIVGQLVSRIRQENRLQNIVNETTDELKQNIDDLIEVEKLASLGGLISKFSKGLEPPLQSALRGIYQIAESSQDILKDFNTGNIKSKVLHDYISKTEENSDIITTSLEKSGDLVNKFKLLATTPYDKFNKNINLKILVNNISKYILTSSTDKNIIIENKIDHNLVVFGNPDDYIQIFTNLIQNSLLHGFKNKEEGIITLNSSVDSEKFILTYSDNGNGIEDRDPDLIFEPFYSTSSDQDGLGLGLNIIKNILIKINSTIQVYANNPGLVFKLQLDKDIIKNRGI